MIRLRKSSIFGIFKQKTEQLFYVDASFRQSSGEEVAVTAYVGIGSRCLCICSIRAVYVMRPELPIIMFGLFSPFQPRF
jgi:hypothetical protein